METLFRYWSQYTKRDWKKLFGQKGKEIPFEHSILHKKEK